MITEDVKHKFFYWVDEREAIREAKDLGDSKPWSVDPTFQTTYFCNVRREDDKVTRWIRDHYDMTPAHAAFNMVIARMVNKPESLEKLKWPWYDLRPDKWREVMSVPGSWGSAYIVSTNGRRMAKHEYVLGLLERARALLLPSTPATLPAPLSVAHRRLQAVPGLASFMAAQVIADLKNTDGHWLAEAVDWKEFAAPGPGSLRGLAWFHGQRITAKDFTDALASARRWGHNNGYGHLISDLCNQDLQNCFCEFDKYMRVSTGKGRSKRRYDGA